MADDTVRSAALLADVHGNVHALRAVLEEIERESVDVVAFPGDITWGTFPHETVHAIRELASRVPVILVRGNADRAAVELADGRRQPQNSRDVWMRERHHASDIDFLRGAVFQADVEVDEVGVLRLCHGSPRSDIELLTSATPPDRLDAATRGVRCDILVTGHTHIQFYRTLHGTGGIRSHVNPGSVGLPYHSGASGARWARISPALPSGVELRITPYDVDAHVAAIRRTDDPAADVIVELLLNPPSPEQVIADAERRIYSD